MKALKILGFLLLGLILAFFLFGILCPSFSYGHEITVNKPIEEAWAVHQDASKYNQWLDGFKSIELLEGEQSAVGSKYKVVVDLDGENPFEMIETIKSIKENDHIELQFDSDFSIFDQKAEFQTKDGKTAVKTTNTVHGKGIINRSMFAAMHILGGTFQKQEEKHINALKTVIESNTTNYFPAPEILEENTATTTQE